MIAAVDIGNTYTEIGVFDGNSLLFSSMTSSAVSRTSLDWAVHIQNILTLYGVPAGEVTGGIIDSSVPSLTRPVADALEQVCGFRPLIVGPGLKTGLKIGIDDPKQLGADIAVAAVGALTVAEAPCVVISMGTADVFSIIDENSGYKGGIIMPGLRMAYEALAKATAQLPAIAFKPPKQVIGTNTVSAMESGAVIGEAARIDGVLERIEEEIGREASAVATGADASLVIPYCNHAIRYEPALMMIGLKKIFNRNNR